MAVDELLALTRGTQEAEIVSFVERNWKLNAFEGRKSALRGFSASQTTIRQERKEARELIQLVWVMIWIKLIKGGEINPLFHGVLNNIRGAESFVLCEQTNNPARIADSGWRTTKKKL